MKPDEIDALPEGEEGPPRGVRAMAALRWLLLGAMALAALFSVSLWLADGASRSRGAEVAMLGGDAATGAPEAKRYHCPMHQQITSDKPDNCPICGMKLVAIERPTGASADAGSLTHLAPVDVPGEQLQVLGVRVEEVRDETTGRELKLAGRIAADPSKLTQVHLRVSGFVEKLFVAAPGTKVNAGQRLVAVYSDELQRLQQELLQAKKWGGETSGPVRQRLLVLGVSAKDISAIEVSGTPQQALVFHSPSNGYLTAVNVANGTRIDPEQALFEIADLSRVLAVAELYERDVGSVREGVEAKLSLDAYPGVTFVGRVEAVLPTLDPNTRTVPVRVAFQNREGKLKPGMFGTLSVSLPAGSGLTVPAEAVIDTGDHRYVFAETAPGHFVPREVTVGSRSGESAVIVAGLSAGERVAASGNFFIDAESRLRASIAGSAAHETSAPGAGPSCEKDFDAKAAPEKYAQCKQCELVHRGMGSMEADCKSAIAKPWRSP